MFRDVIKVSFDAIPKNSEQALQPGMRSPCVSWNSDSDSRVRKFRIPDSNTDYGHKNTSTLTSGPKSDFDSTLGLIA